jgi:serine/threonine protein kinase
MSVISPASRWKGIKPLFHLCLARNRVKLLINRSSGEAVAMKVIDLEKHPDARTTIRKEVCIHRMLTDPHIVRYYGQRREGNVEYIFLEYAAGGELFDRIGEPLHLVLQIWHLKGDSQILLVDLDVTHMPLQRS